MRKAKFLVLSVILILVFSIAVLGQSTNIYPQPSKYGPAILNWGPNVKYGGTLKLLGWMGTTSPNLNPFSPNSLSLTPLIYESLFYVNNVTGDITPVLGTSYEWKGDDLYVKIRQGVKWSDGIPFTANDVAFTFNYIKQNPSLDMGGIWSPINNLQTVVASGDTVIFLFSRPSVSMFIPIAEQYIVPEHIWSSIKDPSYYTNYPNAIGTGPFIFKNYDPANGVCVLTKNPNYWMEGRPFVDQVETYNLKSNDMGLLMMLKGQADQGSFTVVNPNDLWISKDPTNNKFIAPIFAVNILDFNTQEYPFDIPEFRRALDLAINKQFCETSAYSGVGGYNINAAGIIPNQKDEWFDPTLESLSASLVSYNPAEAQQLLASIGFKKNANGQLCAPNGKPLPPYKLITGAGWTDFITIGQVIAQNLKDIGITVNVVQESYGAFSADEMKGNYDLLITDGNGNGTPTPYYMYNMQFNPTFSATEIGKQAISDWSRYTNPLITDALQVYSQTSDLRLQKQAMYTIERILMEDVPFVVLTNRVNNFFYSTKQFVGWPSDSNLYSAGGGYFTIDGWPLVLNVHLK